MNNFQLYKNNSEMNRDYIYLLDVQSALLNDLKTRLVIPLIKRPIKNMVISILNPEIVIKDATYIILTQQMAAVPLNYLGDLVSDAQIDRTNILSAIDFLITGY